MKENSELARILMTISKDKELVKNILSNLAKQFKIKYGENAEKEEKDPNHEIEVALAYDSIVTSCPIIVNDANFKQIIEDRFVKGTHLLLYDRIIADSVIDYYELVFEPLAFGKDYYLCLVSPKEMDYPICEDPCLVSPKEIEDRIDRVFRQFEKLKSKSGENAKEMIKDFLNDLKIEGLIDNSYKIKNRNKQIGIIRKMYKLFNDLNCSFFPIEYPLFLELLLDEKFEIKEKEKWSKATYRV